jgi:hypothetical protein
MGSKGYFLGDCVYGVGFADLGVDEGGLGGGGGEDAVFGDVGAVAVGGLRIFGHGDHCGE